MFTHEERLEPGSRRTQGDKLESSVHGDDSAGYSPQWRGAEPSLPKLRRLTRREVRLVCSLINDGDREFLGTLLAHVKVDSAVARAVVRGVCRTPEMLTPVAAENLLTLLRYQDSPKYARNLALETLRTFEFATAFKLIETCAEILSEHVGTLTTRQRLKLLDRAVAYPAQRAFKPWPADRLESHAEQQVDLDKVDYGGAVSVLLLSKLGELPCGNNFLLSRAVRFARRFPQAENMWLEALGAHAPQALENWQAYLSGVAPRKHVIAGISRAVAVTTLPWLSIQIAGWLAGAPKPPGALLMSVVALSPLWGLQIAHSVLKGLIRAAEDYAVAPIQAAQVLEAALSWRSRRPKA
jgi:hypothetical protein